MIAAGVFSLWLKGPGLAGCIRPGQFLNVKVGPGPDPLLRRPLSVCDVEPGRIRLVFRVVGRGTELLGRVREGEELDVLGPLGRPVPAMRGRDVLLVAGGIGVAPLLLLARRAARGNRVGVVVGARTKRQLLLLREFRAVGVSVKVATDDGSAGQKGVVTRLAEKEVAGLSDPMVFACGPRAMLRDLLPRFDPLQVWGFIEERMGCGTGICNCCALPRRGGGYVRFCEEGPVVLLNEAVL